MKEINPRLKYILTVSPVPLTATRSNRHVVVATMASKSILRAVADQLATNCSYVDYFPSYEIINSPVFRGVFFESNQRSVCSFGVDFVMNSFFQCIQKKYGETGVKKDNNGKIFEKQDTVASEQADEFCDDALLEAFGDKK